MTKNSRGLVVVLQICRIYINYQHIHFYAALYFSEMSEI